MKDKNISDSEILENSNSIRSLAHQIRVSSKEKILEGLRILSSSADDQVISSKNFQKRIFESEARHGKNNA